MLKSAHIWVWILGPLTVWTGPLLAECSFSWTIYTVGSPQTSASSTLYSWYNPLTLHFIYSPSTTLHLLHQHLAILAFRLHMCIGGVALHILFNRRPDFCFFAFWFLVYKWPASAIFQILTAFKDCKCEVRYNLLCFLHLSPNVLWMDN